MKKTIENGIYALQEANKKVNNRWKPQIHAAVPGAWGNDPNGLCWFDDKLHLFYQCNPYDSKWDTMHWGHLTTTDFLHWQVAPVALAPDAAYDSGLGCFSGTSFVTAEGLAVLYTGVSDRQQQCLAFSKDGYVFTKSKNNPVIPVSMLPEDISHEDFRDPKVFERNGVYYCLCCTKRNDLGNIVLFRGKSLESWEYVGFLFDENFETPGPCECPDYRIIDGEEVLIFCPQHKPMDGDMYQNIHPVVYMTGYLDLDTGKFTIHHVDELDKGYDFYAPQTTALPDGRTILIAWKQMWDRNYVTDEDGWVGSFSLPRELSVLHGKLVQRPIQEFTKLLGNEGARKLHGSMEVTQKDIAKNCFCTELSVPESMQGQVTVVFEDDGGKATLLLNMGEKTAVLDRRGLGQAIKEAPGEPGMRKCSFGTENGRVKLQLLFDVSSLEVFFGEGDAVMTANLYPAGDVKVRIEAEGESYELR